MSDMHLKLSIEFFLDYGSIDANAFIYNDVLYDDGIIQHHKEAF